MAEAAGPNFYNRVMGASLQPRTNVPLPTDPSPEKETLHPEFVKYLKLAVFKVEAVTNSPEEQERKFYWEFLSDLTEKELKALQKKINLLANTLIGDHENADDFEKLRHLAAETINHRLKRSDGHTRALQKKVFQRLETMGKVSAMPHGGEHTFVKYQEKKLPLADFAGAFFHDIIKTYDELIEKGEVIRAHKEDNGGNFVRSCLIEKLVTRLL